MALTLMPLLFCWLVALPVLAAKPADDWRCAKSPDTGHWSCAKEHVSNDAVAGAPVLAKGQTPKMASNSLSQTPPQIESEVIAPSGLAAARESGTPIDEQASTPVESIATDESTSSSQLPVAPEAAAMAAITDEARPETSKSARSVGSTDATPSTTSRPLQDSTSVDEPGLPEFQRLAYAPDQPTSLLELPGEFWVVQLMAVSSKELLEAYAEEHDLRGLSAARIASGDRLFYVLILGIYETMDRAQRAISTLPPPYNTYKPLLRTLDSLQQAMRKADEITGEPLADPSGPARQ